MRLQHVEEIAGNIRTGGRIGGKRIVKCLPRNFYEDLPELTWNSVDRDPATKHLFAADDLLRFAAQPRQQLGTPIIQQLQEELNFTLSSMVNILSAGGSQEPNNDEISSLPMNIKARRKEAQDMQEDLNTITAGVCDLIAETNITHDNLQKALRKALTETFQVHDKFRSATTDLVATMIETSLIKLSLIRARSQQALYDYRPTTDAKSPRSMAKALDAAHRKLRKDEQRLKEDEFQVDQQLQEYEGVLKIVDVSSGGYRQLIDDWVRVKRETEECRRDLRRLGWTGPD